jgi:hypothetical protein
MPTIMSYFFYEHSCRRLLAILTDKVTGAMKHRDEHNRRGEAEDDKEKRYIEALLKAADSVDEQCKKLEFWSDVRDLTRDGKMIKATDDDGVWKHEWVGLDQSGPQNLDAPPLTVQDNNNSGQINNVQAEDEGEDEYENDEHEGVGASSSGGWNGGVQSPESSTAKSDTKISSSSAALAIGDHAALPEPDEADEELTEQLPEPIILESEPESEHVVSKGKKRHGA